MSNTQAALPEPAMKSGPGSMTRRDYYSADQMLAYGEACARAALAQAEAAHKAPDPCCGEFAVCTKPCTPRGEWIADRRHAAEASQPVAWCSLTPSGHIEYFDGKPMVMPGPVGNEMHQTPLFAGAAP